jgi:serine/threonine-protein kinase
VTITVSAGVPQVQVPDVRGKKADEATQILQKAGLTVKVQTFIAGSHVQQQSPSAGATVDQGTQITLLVFG